MTQIRTSMRKLKSASFRRVVAGPVFCLFLLAGCVSQPVAQDWQFTRAPKEWSVPLKPFQIFDNIYYVGATGMSSYLVSTPSGLILLDCGTAETAALVLENIKQLGFNPRQVKILVGLHGHYDHIGGAAVVKKAAGAKLFVGAGDRALVESGGRNDPQFGDHFAWKPVAVDRVLRDGDKIELGGIELKVHATPGHTPGCITCTMKARKGDGSYDVVFAGSVSCPDYKLAGNPRYPGIADEFTHTFQTLKPCIATFFLPNTGGTAP
jgi:metallo-beta-lactamase class B